MLPGDIFNSVINTRSYIPGRIAAITESPLVESVIPTKDTHIPTSMRGEGVGVDRH